MPRRTNSFQQLITCIETQLAENPTSVTESKIVSSYSGNEQREIDVAIEAKVNGHPIFLAIECRDWSVPQDVTWIDDLIGKYRNLPVHKVIAVSKSGFTAGATIKAKENGIETLTLEAASTLNWTAQIEKLVELTVEGFIEPHLESVEVVFEETASKNAFGKGEVKNHVLHSVVSPASSTTLEAFVDKIVSSSEMAQACQQHAPIGTNAVAKVNVRFSGRYVIDKHGQRHSIVGINLRVRTRVDRFKIPLSHFAYGENRIAIGTGSLIDRPLFVSLVEKPGQAANLAITVRPESNKPS